ncbi:MAG TPA: potassium channel family protein [Solirubrobacteraceae bacterium]|nr:potassium channel family protein [Solirubrobacteraceae bacterium]
MSESRADSPELGPARRLSPIDRLYLRRYARLLAVIAAAFLLEGIAKGGRWELALLAVLLGATLLLAMHASKIRWEIFRIAAGFVVVVVVLSLLQAVFGEIDERLVKLANSIVVLFGPPVIMLGVVRRMRETQTVPVDAVIGVLCVYLLLGMFFANLYGSLENVGGKPFFAQDVPATIAHCTYFSFTTLSTIGYGDLTAATNLGRTLAVSEGLLGQVYLVTVVSLIVGNLGRRRSREERLDR